MAESNKYILFYSDNTDKLCGRREGVSPGQLMNEFHALGRRYKYAHISKIGENKILYAFDTKQGEFVTTNKQKKDDGENVVYPITEKNSILGFRTKKRQFTKSFKDYT